MTSESVRSLEGQHQFFIHVTFSGLNQYGCGGSFMCEAFAFCPLVLFVNSSFEIISLKKIWLL